MSQFDLEILYHVFAPNNTAAGAEEKRNTHVNEHIDWIKECVAAGTVRHGGVLLAHDQTLPITTFPETMGYTYMVKANDLAAARKFFEQDPYYKVGAFDNANIRIVPVLSKA